jgi:hypothetical protein
MYRLMAHEYGHALGLNHSNVAQAIMQGGIDWSTRISVDDADGIINGTSEGKRLRAVKTASALTTTPGGNLNFKAITTAAILNTNALWLPAIAGNKAALGSGPHSNWQFAIAWVDANYYINVSTAKDGATSDSPISFIAQARSDFKTRNAPGLAVSPTGLVGIAWTGIDAARSVNVAVSNTDGFGGWTRTTLPGGWAAIGGVSLTFSAVQNRWVLAWNSDSSDTMAANILVTVSDDAAGTIWTQPVWYFTDNTMTMPIRQPAITCMREDQSRCAIGMLSYMFTDKPLMTAMLTIDQYLSPIPLTGGLDLSPNLTYGFSSLGMARFPQGHLMTYTDGLEPAKMKYAHQLDSDGDTARFTTHEWTNGPVSRTGFGVGWNYKTGSFRFLWRED